MIRSARLVVSVLMLLGLSALISTTSQAADKVQGNAAPAKKSTKPTPNKKPSWPAMKPTLANVPYGTHEREVLDFYKAESAKPTPLLFYIHGGGWVNGDKKMRMNYPYMHPYLSSGISIVSINYRYTTQAQEAGVKPPVEWPMRDAARALQFVRSKAAEWNIDKERIGVSGGSAGACTSLWLALHDDMADPKSSDPVARESTRLWCAAVSGPQTTLDPKQMKQWTPNSRYGGHAFGFMPDTKNLKTRDTQFPEFLAARERWLPWIKEYSPYAHVTADDPPIYMIFRAPPAIGENQKDPTHTANFGVKLAEKLQSVGVPCEVVYPGATNVQHPTVESYLLEKLKSPKAQTIVTTKRQAELLFRFFKRRRDAVPPKADRSSRRCAW